MARRSIPGHPAAATPPTSLEWATDGELAAADLAAILRRLEQADGGRPCQPLTKSTSPASG